VSSWYEFPKASEQEPYQQGTFRQHFPWPLILLVWPSHPCRGNSREKRVTTKEILRSFKRIAVVGISNNPQRASNGVSRYMLRNGYDIVPVNPQLQEFEGIQAYPDLDSVPGEVEILNIFRRSEHVPALVEAAIRKSVKVVWMQLEVVHEEAAARAREAGIHVVMDRCILQEHMAQRWDD
jgi:uncharacterized protein